MHHFYLVSSNNLCEMMSSVEASATSMKHLKGREFELEYSGQSDICELEKHCVKTVLTQK